ncbi:MAG: methyltransferase domain-containing protein [Proteobacteria bacterium]|nr:methyltransferase domain-containing protein [Pseudomonadota bacterium]
MPAQTPHRVFPEPNHDESSRQNFVMALRMHVLKDLLGGNKEVYEARVEPAFRKEHSRPPKSRHEVRKAMDHIPYFQMYSSLLRTSQEMIWDSIGSSIERQWDGLIQKTRSNGSVRGSVTIDPALKVPPYLAAVDHHCMPGSYHTEYRNEDVFNGALYDRGAYLYALGAAGKLHDDRGRTISAYIKRTHPSLDPRRILDMGCTVGASTLAYCDEFPEAEVCAIDIGAPMVRYGHARAEAFGRRVQFSQQNAEHTNFDDGSFDLVVSHVMLHETSRTAMINIMNESWRLLRPGGVMVHLEVPHRLEGQNLYEDFIRDWDTNHNAEPFWGVMNSIDTADFLSRHTVWQREALFERLESSARKGGKNAAYTGQWFIFGGQKPG